MLDRVARWLALVIVVATLTMAPAAYAVPGETADKVSWKPKRLTHRTDDVCSWTGQELMKLRPDGGKHHVFMQIRYGKKHGWQHMVRQTTLAHGRFDFAAWGKAGRKKYQTREYEIVGAKSSYTYRLYVPGDETHRPYRGDYCQVTFGG